MTTEERAATGASAKPCGGCPWVRKNQTEEVVRASPQGGHWYDPKNLKNQWGHVAKKGGMLPCHETDPFANEYGGEASCASRQRICVGVSTLAYREVTHFMRCGNSYERYKRASGIRMTLLGLASWAARLLYHGAFIDVGPRSMEIPHIDEDNPNVCVPWTDALNPE